MRNNVTSEVISLIDKTDFLILEFCTGFGKTYNALKIIEKLGGKWMIALAEVLHKDNWIDEIEKHDMSHLLKDIHFIQYASLHKEKGSEYYGVIYDEAHHLSEYRLESDKLIDRVKTIYLSATLEDSRLSNLGLNNSRNRLSYDLDKFNINRFNNKILFSIFLKQAIHWGIIIKPRILLYKIRLDETKLVHTVEMFRGKRAPLIEDDYSNRWKYLSNSRKYPNYRLRLKCTEKEKYEYLEDQFKYWQKKYFSAKEKHKNDNTDIGYLEAFYLRKGLDRKNFLEEVKVPHIKKFLPTIKDKRFICFGGSINTIKQLSTINLVHSKNKDKQNTKLIKQFNNGASNSLFAVNKLQEGINLDNIEEGIIVQLQSGLRYSSQVIGRILRAKKEPTQHIFYVTDSRDVDYVKTAMEGFMDMYKIIEL